MLVPWLPVLGINHLPNLPGGIMAQFRAAVRYRDVDWLALLSHQMRGVIKARQWDSRGIIWLPLRILKSIRGGEPIGGFILFPSGETVLGYMGSTLCSAGFSLEGHSLTYLRGFGGSSPILIYTVPDGPIKPNVLSDLYLPHDPTARHVLGIDPPAV